MASVALPEMKRYNYSPRLSCGAVAAGGGRESPIPPRRLIDYAILTEQSNGALLSPASCPPHDRRPVLPDDLFQCKINPKLGPAGLKQTGLRNLSLPPDRDADIVLPCHGRNVRRFFTPTEAAAIGAAGSQSSRRSRTANRMCFAIP
jgi:hypothetical protein